MSKVQIQKDELLPDADKKRRRANDNLCAVSVRSPVEILLEVIMENAFKKFPNLNRENVRRVAASSANTKLFRNLIIFKAGGLDALANKYPKLTDGEIKRAVRTLSESNSTNIRKLYQLLSLKTRSKKKKPVKKLPAGISLNELMGQMSITPKDPLNKFKNLKL